MSYVSINYLSIYKGYLINVRHRNMCFNIYTTEIPHL